MSQDLRYFNVWDAVAVAATALITVGSFVLYLKGVSEGEQHLPWIPLIFMVVTYGLYERAVNNHELNFYRAVPQPKSAADDIVTKLAAKGFQLQSRNKTQLQFMRKKQFSLFWSLAWLLVAFVGLIIYLLYYMSKKDDLLTVKLTND